MLKFFNTLSRSKEEFIPINKDLVRMYSCGPTVYNFMHIGNLRTFFFEDILLRVLKYNGYNVKYIMNITDVGHLTEDSDDGDDKMEKFAKEQGTSVWDIAKYYTDAFFKDIIDMNIIPPEKYTKASDYISQQIEMVQCLEKKGFTYNISDGVYYDTSKFPDYGKLARLDIKGLQEGARVEFNKEKRNITDFALWKFSPKNEKRQMEWESPWGTGFPGWHIECSAMSKAELGNHFDIHSSAIDHIPIHHTNEIAQSEACNGEKFVNYWLHGEHLDMGSEKMSKSLGNFVTLQSLIKEGYSPMDYRYFLLMAHYRKKLKFSMEALDGARNGYRNLSNKIVNLITEAGVSGAGLDSNSKVYAEYKERFLETINDDLNMPEAMAILWEVLRNDKLNASEKLYLTFDFDNVFGLRLNEITTDKKAENVPAEVIQLAEKRIQAKKDKNFKMADDIRNEIRSKGYEVTDKKDGFEIKKL